ncbi:MAG: hypothetical protein JWR51_4675 [Devosia sp.]|uniref:hypothetical protein n=1 Tax=Devosia sp. TaxID=1871048 RepID=UPI002602EA5C|nr:hypothetical protein [Devosia sp.]MDB5531572.1 hypothetical protein [Devosia sp.]
MRTRVRQSSFDWRVDRLVLGFLWVPMGRWIAADWWSPYQFDTASDALHFANVARARASLQD